MNVNNIYLVYTLLNQRDKAAEFLKSEIKRDPSNISFVMSINKKCSFFVEVFFQTMRFCYVKARSEKRL